MTYQIRDTLIYEGQTYALNQELLEGYFAAYPEKRPEIEVVCTALWRGYQATFEIRDQQLFVKDLDGFMTQPDAGAFTQPLFPNQNKFEWYSGWIRIDNYRGDWDEEYEGATFEYLEIYKGNFIQKRTMDFEALQTFKALQFEYFKTTPAYERAFDLWRGNNPDLEDEKIQGYLYSSLLQRHTTLPFDSPFLQHSQYNFETGLLFYEKAISYRAPNKKVQQQGKWIEQAHPDTTHIPLEYVWTLYRLENGNVPTTAPRFLSPTNHLGAGLAAEWVVLNLNCEHCFAFDYAPQAGDQLQIQRNIRSSPYLSFMYQNGVWKMDNAQPTKALLKIKEGRLEPTPYQV